MKKFILGIFALLSVSTYASHLKGGQVFWEALGNNQYIFHLNLYVECNSVAMIPNATLTIDGNTTIQVSQTGSFWPSSSCTSCTGNEIKVYEYKSAVTTYVMPTNSPSVDIVYTSCCMPVTSNLAGNPTYLFKSTMYRAGINRSSARFDEHGMIGAQIDLSKGMAIGVSNKSGGTVHTSLTPVQVPVSSGGYQSVTYNAGYSDVNPTGGAMDVLTANGVYYPYTSLTGLFIISMTASSENVLGTSTSDVNIIFPYYLLQSSSGSNDVPSVSANYRNVAWQTSDSTVFNVSVLPGDSVKMRLFATDVDFLPNFISQTILAGMSGSNPDTMHVATLTPVAPQASLSSTLNNTVDFKWRVPSNIASGTYQFKVTFTDDLCPNPGASSVLLNVVVQGAPVVTGTYKICAGGTAVLGAPVSGTVYSWNPTVGLSSPNTAFTTASPSVSTMYTITVDGQPVGQYFVEVGQHATPLAIQPQPNQIELTNPGDFDNHAFSYYYVPFAVNDTIVTVTASGLYHIIGQNAGCFDISDSIWVSPDSLYNVVLISNPLGENDVTTLQPTDRYEMEVQIGGWDGTVAVREILIPGGAIGGKMGGVHLEVFDAASNTTVSLPGVAFGGHSIKFLPSSPVYLVGSSVSLVVDSGSIQVPLLRDQAMPYGYDFTFINSVDGMVGSDTLTDDIIPFVFRGDMEVGVEEFTHSQELKVYPQPANDWLFVEIEESTEYQLFNVSGQLMSEGVVHPENGISVRELQSGMYVLSLSNTQSQHSVLVVVQH